MAHNYKLRVNEVLEIKNQLAEGKSMNKIAKDFSVTLATIRAINQGETHSDVGSFSHPIREKKRLLIHEVEKPEPPKKLSDDQALDVMIRLDMGENLYALAKEYGVSHELIRKISKRPAFRLMATFDDDF